MNAETATATTHEERAGREGALEYYDLSIPWGHGVANWPYFEDVKIERVHYHAKSRVLTQRITTVMHSTTHVDVPAHVIEGTPFLDEIPLHCFFGPGVVVSIPKEKWEVVTADDLEKARPKIQPGDIVIVNTGWHRHYGDNADYYAYSPGFYEDAGEWFVERGVKAVGHRHPGPRPPARDRHRAPRPGLAPRAAARGPARSTRRRPGHDVLEDFPLWEPCHRALLVPRHRRLRERGRRHRRRHRQAGHLRRLPVAVDEGRRLHHPPRRHARPDAASSASRRGRPAAMKVNRFAEVSKYDPPNHFDCTALRLQGWDASDAASFWVGLSHFLPGGGTTHEGTPLEKVYVVVRGEVTVVTDDAEATLGPFDSCHIPAGEARTVVNRTNDVASMIVVMPYPEGSRDRPGVGLRPHRPLGRRHRRDRRVRAVAARTYALAGARVTLAGGSADKLEQLGADLGGDVALVPRRPDTEADTEAMVDAAVRAHGALDIVVTACSCSHSLLPRTPRSPPARSTSWTVPRPPADCAASGLTNKEEAEVGE